MRDIWKACIVPCRLANKLNRSLALELFIFVERRAIQKKKKTKSLPDSGTVGWWIKKYEKSVPLNLTKDLVLFAIPFTVENTTFRSISVLFILDYYYASWTDVLYISWALFLWEWEEKKTEYWLRNMTCLFINLVSYVHLI